MCKRHCGPGHGVRYVEVVRVAPGTKAMGLGGRVARTGSHRPFTTGGFEI